MDDRELLQDTIRKAHVAFRKRKLEFCEALKISEREYDFALEHKGDLEERPFMRSPLAQDAFVYGWVCCRRKFVSDDEEKSDG